MRCIGRVDQDGAGGELLATHGVPSAGHADRLALAAGSRERRLDSGLRIDRDDALDVSLIELRMQIVDVDASGGRARQRRRQRDPDSGPGGAAKELTSCRHVSARLRAGCQLRTVVAEAVAPVHIAAIFLAAVSLGLDIGSLEDGRPAGDLGLHEAVELRRRALVLARQRSAEIGKARLDEGIVQRLVESGG